jgi:methyltransferase (TIGR00027 family)
MRNEEFSRTALATAAMRAAHQVLDGDNLVLNDPIAVRLLGPYAAKHILESKGRFAEPVSVALRSHVVLRSRFAEDRLQAAVARGLRQYVLVGAGLDTFAMRQPAWAQELSIIEVDHPATQVAKRALMESAELPSPDNLQFVAVDFEQEPLHDALRRHHVDTTQPSFFSWLGVTMYLTEPALDSTLAAMADFPSGSEVVLTFSQPPENRSQFESALSAALSKHVADVGEPFVSYFEPAAMEAKLRGVGFSVVEFLAVDDAKARYFQSTSLPPPRRTGIVAAIR